MKIIKDFEGEELEVSDFGEWVGHDYIDYKSDYKEHQKIINDLLKQRQELIEYLKSEIKSWKDKIFENTLTEDNFTLALWRSRLITYEKVLNKIEKSDKQ